MVNKISHHALKHRGSNLFFRKLAEVLTEKQSALEKNNAISQRLQLMEKENNDVRLSLQEQRKLLMEKKAQIMDTESRS